MIWNSNVSGVQPSKITRNYAQKTSLLLCPLQQHICANLDFPLYVIWKTRVGTVWTPQTIACGPE